MDWYIRLALDEYKQRVEEGQRDHEFYQARFADRGNRSISSGILTLAGRLIVDLGKRLQRWGGTPTDILHAGTR